MYSEKRMNNKEGYMTVEATLIFSSVLIIIFSVIFALMLMYQYIVVLNASAQAVRETVAMCEKHDDYSESFVKTQAKSSAEKRLKYGILNIDGNTQINVSKPNIFLFDDKVVVEIKQKIDIPLGNLLMYFSGKEFAITGYSEGVISGARTAKKQINNVDLAIEFTSRVGNEVKDLIKSFIKIDSLK